MSDCIEASESSCTLIDQLTPVDQLGCNELFGSTSLTIERKINGSSVVHEEWKLFDTDLVDENGIEVGKDEYEDANLFHATPTSEPASTPINVTPTKEAIMSKRRERLQTVRAQFYSLYAKTIRFRSPVSEQSSSGPSSSGIGSFIGNFATKVGIRAANRPYL